MKKIIAIVILLIFCLSLPSECWAYTKGKAHVKSYTKKNGKRVKAHTTTVKRKIKKIF